jgi:hypothetical protein
MMTPITSRKITLHRQALETGVEAASGVVVALIGAKPF